jgi:hypothetical protein
MAAANKATLRTMQSHRFLRDLVTASEAKMEGQPWARSKLPVKGNNVPEKKSKSQRRHEMYNTPGYNSSQVSKGNPNAEYYEYSDYENNPEDWVEGPMQPRYGVSRGGPVQRLYGTQAHYPPEFTVHSDLFGKRLHGSNEPRNTPGQHEAAWQKTEKRNRRLRKRAIKKSKKAAKKAAKKQ